MAVEIEKVGRRNYLTGTPYASRHVLRSAGCKWDASRSCWWTGKRTTAEELCERLNSQSSSGQLEGHPVKIGGDWCVRLPGVTPVARGAKVKVTTRGGKSWLATVTRTVRVDADAVVVATESDRPRSSRSGRNSRGYDSEARAAAGATRRAGGRACRECGGDVQTWSAGASVGLCHDCV